jgi:hypothetical protein
MKTKLFRPVASLLALLQALAFAATSAVAQTADAPEMADALRANGKIYVVVAVVLVIVAGLLAYLIALDRKVSRLEKLTATGKD